MPQKPQRPFVPHRTPTTPRPAIAASEFRLYTPFVPGVAREPAEVNALPASTNVTELRPDVELLRPIEDFLENAPASSPVYDQGVEDLPDVGDFGEESDELPPVEHFMDTLPDVDPFTGSTNESSTGNGSTRENVTAAGPTQESPESGWGEADWQRYDWQGAAALGETGSEEASSAWAMTDWEGNVPRARELRKSAAHAIATALDEIAQRIRAGEQVAPGSGALDPTNIAATLAALLGIKR